MNTYGQPVHKCASLIDFLKCMYDVLEAHRWAVLERNVTHRDISHVNIILSAEHFGGTRKEGFKGKENRPIFVNEVLNSELYADPMAYLGDLDNAAESDREAAAPRSFVSRKSRTYLNDKPLHRRTGTPKFIARSPAVGFLLVYDINFRRMPTLPSHLADRYAQVYSNDRSCLRTFSDHGATRHGGVYTEAMEEMHDRNLNLCVTQFEHRPRHDAESVFWCIVVFLLVAVPVGSSPEDLLELNCAWKYMANHNFGAPYGLGDSRLSLLRVPKWKLWLQPELAHAEDFLLALAAQITPEWGLIEPAPPILHLHEAMQRIILKYIDLWKTQEMDVKFDTGLIRPADIPDNETMRQVSHKPSVNGQDIAASALRPKRQSNQLGKEMRHHHAEA